MTSLAEPPFPRQNPLSFVKPFFLSQGSVIGCPLADQKRTPLSRAAYATSGGTLFCYNFQRLYDNLVWVAPLILPVRKLISHKSCLIIRFARNQNHADMKAQLLTVSIHQFINHGDVLRNRRKVAHSLNVHHVSIVNLNVWQSVS